MPAYDFENLVKAWAKSAFGLFVGFTVFYAFNSVFLGVLAATFFFFIPISNPANERIVNTSIFGGVMLIILFWAFGQMPFEVVGLGLDLGGTGMPALGSIIFLIFIGLGVTAAITRQAGFAMGALGALIVAFVVLQPWTWNTSAIIFVAVWVIGFAAGVGGDVQTRPTIGAIVLFVCFIIFTVGVGTQDVGAAFFGEWWPTVYNQFTSMTGPLGTAWGQMSKTLGDGWMMLTDPVGYASRLMTTGTAVNPIGDAGNVGVDLISFEVTPILIDQPFQITTNVKNRGYSDAQNVSMTLSLGVNSVYASGSIADKLTTQQVQLSALGIDTSNCFNSQESSISNRCIYYGPEDTKRSDQTFEMLDIWQPFFTSNIDTEKGIGIICKVANQFELRKKSIPVNITLRYRYTTNASLGKGTDKMEFISQAEWDRLAKLDKLEQKELSSEYTAGPVKLIVAPVGLEVPIRENVEFNIGFNLISAQKGGRIESVDYVRLYHPSDFVPISCTKPCDPQAGYVECKNLKGSGDKYFYCRFKLKEGTMAGSPTKSYIVTAQTAYTYSVSQDKLMKVDFGSWCCQDSDCGSGYRCDIPSGDTKGTCVPSPTSSTTPSVTIPPATPPATMAQPSQPAIVQYIDNAYAQTNVETAMIKAIIMTESSFVHYSNGVYTVSRTGCVGFMQLSNIAVQDLYQSNSPFKDIKAPSGSKYLNRYDPADNIMAGAAYFASLGSSRYGCTDQKSQIATYNQGPPCKTGTGAYVDNVLAYYQCYLKDPTWYGPVDKNTCNRV